MFASDSCLQFETKQNNWKRVAHMYDDRKYGCACAFMDKIVIIGGGTRYMNATDSCWQFDTKDNSWKEVARMNDARILAVCAVFEGKIVVTGGLDNNYISLNTVESYDAFSDTWSHMPNMIERRYEHSLVVVKNKLFVIGLGRNNSEVLDSACNKFVVLKSPDISRPREAVLVGNKIFLFTNYREYVAVYDVVKDKWSEEPCDATENIDAFACVKLPIY